MNDEGAAAGIGHGSHEMNQLLIGIAVVHADAGLDGDGYRHRPRHGRHAVRHQRRLRHQAGAEASALDAVAGAADVEIDLVIAPVRAHASAFGQGSRLAAAELQGQRLFRGIKIQQTLPGAMQDGAGRDHFGVQKYPRRDQPQEIAAMPVRPVQHGGHGDQSLAGGCGHVRRDTGGDTASTADVGPAGGG